MVLILTEYLKWSSFLPNVYLVIYCDVV